MAELYDVTANGCGYTAFVLDNSGSVNLIGCSANSNTRHGIQIDGSSGAYLENCVTNSNAMSGSCHQRAPYRSAGQSDR